MANATPFAPLPRSFYARPAEVVAKDALGKILAFERDGVTLAGRIVEAEAYLGIRDRAAHSFGGRRTARNEVMWGPPGFAYVFFIYGMHFHLNLVTDDEGLPCAVLLRAVEPILGEEVMRVLKWFAALVIVVIVAGAVVLWTGGESAKLSEMAGYGPQPELPAPNATLVPGLRHFAGPKWVRSVHEAALLERRPCPEAHQALLSHWRRLRRIVGQAATALRRCRQ